MKKGFKQMLVYEKMKIMLARLFPVIWTKVNFKRVFGYDLDLSNPKTFSEKIQWLKLKFYPNYSLAAYAGDKATIHNYLDEKGLKNLKVPLVGIYNDYSKIDWNKVPNRFVVKKSNASGLNVVVEDKKSIDISELENLIKKWMTRDFGKEMAEHHYCKMTSKIVIEEFMEGIEKEYQLYTFNGKVKSLQVMEFQVESCSDEILEGKTINSRNYISLEDFNKTNFLPDFENLIEAAEKIGSDFPLSRVDFFYSKGHWYIGEVTLTPASGFNTLSKEQQIEWGDWLELPIVR